MSKRPGGEGKAERLEPSKCRSGMNKKPSDLHSGIRTTAKLLQGRVNREAAGGVWADPSGLKTWVGRTQPVHAWLSTKHNSVCLKYLLSAYYLSG